MNRLHIKMWCIKSLFSTTKILSEGKEHTYNINNIFFKIVGCIMKQSLENTDSGLFCGSKQNLGQGSVSHNLNK